jgi:IS605 OrfB family transposase
MLLRVVKLKMLPTDQQKMALLSVLEQFNAACNWISQQAYEQKAFRRIPLRAIGYYHVRETFALPAQLAILAFDKVIEAYKRDKSVLHTFDCYAAATYDSRVFRLIGITYASMTLLYGRETIRLDCGSYQRRMLAGKPDIRQTDLCFDGGLFYLAVTVRRNEPPKKATDGFLGVDMGIVNVAVDSEGNSYTGEPIQRVRRKYREMRRSLQQKQTKGAKRRLMAIRRRQFRFVRHTNHCISKQIVATALHAGKALAVEALQGIRQRDNGCSRSLRWLLGNWALFQLRQFLTYMAAEVGLSVVAVDPAYTSQTCSACGHCERDNRKSQAQFCCLKCGLMLNADFNAALNVLARAASNPA